MKKYLYFKSKIALFLMSLAATSTWALDKLDDDLLSQETDKLVHWDDPYESIESPSCPENTEEFDSRIEEIIEFVSEENELIEDAQAFLDSFPTNHPEHDLSSINAGIKALTSFLANVKTLVAKPTRALKSCLESIPDTGDAKELTKWGLIRECKKINNLATNLQDRANKMMQNIAQFLLKMDILENRIEQVALFTNDVREKAKNTFNFTHIEQDKKSLEEKYKSFKHYFLQTLKTMKESDPVESHTPIYDKIENKSQELITEMEEALEELIERENYLKDRSLWRRGIDGVKQFFRNGISKVP